MAAPTAVLVTGCSSGIGRATAVAFAEAGVPVWASARRLEAIADLADVGCRTVQLDVTDEESRVRAVKTVEAEHGAVGALVNNAGYTQVGPVEEVSLESLRQVFDTNVFGVVRLCQLVLPGMRARGSGTIVNMGSVAGLLTPPASSAYSMTKYSLEALSDALRLEVAHFGVRVVLLEPGGARTQLLEVGMQTMPDGNGPYDTFRENVSRMVVRSHRPSSRSLIGAEQVAQVVVKAVTARRPRTRYKVGNQAKVAPLVRRLMPDRLWDRMMTRVAPLE